MCIFGECSLRAEYAVSMGATLILNAALVRYSVVARA